MAPRLEVFTNIYSSLSQALKPPFHQLINKTHTTTTQWTNLKVLHVTHIDYTHLNFRLWNNFKIYSCACDKSANLLRFLLQLLLLLLLSFRYRSQMFPSKQAKLPELKLLLSPAYYIKIAHWKMITFRFCFVLLQLLSFCLNSISGCKGTSESESENRQLWTEKKWIKGEKLLRSCWNYCLFRFVFVFNAAVVCFSHQLKLFVALFIKFESFFFSFYHFWVFKFSISYYYVLIWRNVSF